MHYKPAVGDTQTHDTMKGYIVYERKSLDQEERMKRSEYNLPV